jgi:hypothetical protein
MNLTKQRITSRATMAKGQGTLHAICGEIEADHLKRQRYAVLLKNRYRSVDKNLP